MSAGVLDLGITGLVAAVAIMVGWWLHGLKVGSVVASEEATDDDAGAELARARRVIPVLQSLASAISTDVDAHSSRVEEINRSLSSEHDDQETVVLDAVSSLLASNQEMQQQLVAAKGKLQEQAREVKSQAEAARTDVLTQLANRRALDDELAKRKNEYHERGVISSLAMIDVDNFKKFNDTHGHQAGDEVLRGVSRVLQQTTRDGDFVARYGGEEFAFILPGGLTDENESHVDRVREAIELARFQFGDLSLQVTVSLGIAQLTPDEEVASLIERSDVALYAAKESGRNCVCAHDGETTRQLFAPKSLSVVSDQALDAIQPPVEPEPGPEREAPKSLFRDEQQWPGGVVAVAEDKVCNRTAFCNSLGNCLSKWEQGGPMPSVLLIQVDDYDGIISQHGQKVGNPVLGATARFVVASLREEDTIADYDLATYAILFPGIERVRMVATAENLRANIAKFILRQDKESLRFTVSMGGSEPVENDNVQAYLQRIEGGLRDAIAAGGNHGQYYDGTSFQPAGQILETNTS